MPRRVSDGASDRRASKGFAPRACRGSAADPIRIPRPANGSGAARESGPRRSPRRSTCQGQYGQITSSPTALRVRFRAPRRARPAQAARGRYGEPRWRSRRRCGEEARQCRVGRERPLFVRPVGRDRRHTFERLTAHTGCVPVPAPGWNPPFVGTPRRGVDQHRARRRSLDHVVTGARSPNERFCAGRSSCRSEADRSSSRKGLPRAGRHSRRDLRRPFARRAYEAAATAMPSPAIFSIAERATSRACFSCSRFWRSRAATSDAPRASAFVISVS